MASESETRVIVTCESLDAEGYGVARLQSSTLLVRDLLPGERAEVEIEHRSQHKDRAWGRIHARLGASSGLRQEPFCPMYETCGGCVWQHLQYPGQLHYKRARILEALQQQGIPTDAVPSAVFGAKSPLHYRNKGKYVFGRTETGLTLGAYRPRTHQVSNTLGCQVVEPAIDRVAHVVRDETEASKLPIYDEAGAHEGLRYAILRSNEAGEVLVALVCTSETPQEAMQRLAERIESHHDVVGVLRCDNDLKSGGLLTETLSVIAGKGTVTETVSGVQLDLGIHAFWQVHREQAARVYADIAQLLDLHPPAYVLELFCGTGGIAFSLAKAGLRVLGIDTNEESIAAAQHAAQRAGLEAQLSFRVHDARSLPTSDFDTAAAVVVDPPRKGLGEAGRKLLCDRRPAAIAYLSCGPESLANDLKSLLEVGYEIAAVRLYDFMPGTAQVECLVLLRLGRG